MLDIDPRRKFLVLQNKGRSQAAACGFQKPSPNGRGSSDYRHDAHLSKPGATVWSGAANTRRLMVHDTTLSLGHSFAFLRLMPKSPTALPDSSASIATAANATGRNRHNCARVAAATPCAEEAPMSSMVSA